MKIFISQRRNVVVNLLSSYRMVHYVPKHNQLKPSDIDVFQHFINTYKDILILSGAGISTESGIPDYRSEDVGLYARSNHKPVQYQEFVAKQHVRKRYWARNYVGWPRFSNIQPNITHTTLGEMENEKKVIGVVTQNVDRLHMKAGSKNVIELHGSSYVVKCLKCPFEVDRASFQKVLESLNPDMKETSNFIRPDGDVELSEVCQLTVDGHQKILTLLMLQDQVAGFEIPNCTVCGSEGSLKPDIVFFGDNVPKERVKKVEELVTQCGALLVLGSSLTVFSSYRILLQAQDLHKYIVIVNIGPTRGDQHANIKLSVKCGDLFSRYKR